MATTQPDETLPVLDVHHHVGNAFRALGGALENAEGLTAGQYAERELTSRLEIMDSGGVAQALVIPGHGYERSRGIVDTRAENDAIAAYRDARPDRFPAAVGVVEPRDGAASFEEIDRIASLGLVGISFHTRFQGVSLDSRWILQYCERMASHGLVPVIHAMDDTPEEALWKLAALGRALPDVPMLALDPFSSYEATRQCFFVAELAPSIVMDTSLSYNFDFIEDFVRQFGAERVAFGTDLYSYPVGRRISHLLPQILESELSDDEKRAVLGDTARRLFGLEPPA
ncbi:MAG: amidohydrolase family protein [Myxococcota bacterium]